MIAYKIRKMLSFDTRGWCDQYVPGYGPTIWSNTYSLELDKNCKVVSAIIIKSEFVRYATESDEIRYKDIENAWQGEFYGAVAIDAPAKQLE